MLRFVPSERCCGGGGETDEMRSCFLSMSNVRFVCPSLTNPLTFVGMNCMPRLVTYSLSWIVLMWLAMVASVPIPCLSISEMSSTSEMKFGASVLP